MRKGFESSKKPAATKPDFSALKRKMFVLVDEDGAVLLDETGAVMVAKTKES